MKKLKILFVSIFCIISFSQSYSQARMWENFTDMKELTSVAVSENSVYCGSKGGVFVVSNNGTIIEKFTNINGLLSNDILSLYLDSQRRLWIGASDGSIVIYDVNNKLFKYIYDIKNSTESDKSISSFQQFGNFIFVGTGYGIQKISIVNFSFVDAPYYQLGNYAPRTKVTSLTLLNNLLFAGTISGVSFANVSTSNLNNPSSWTNFNSFGMSNSVNTVAAFDNKVFAGTASNCMYYENGNWAGYPNNIIFNNAVRTISPVQNRIYFSLNNSVYFANQGSLENVNLYLENVRIGQVTSFANGNPILASLSDGLFINTNQGYQFVAPNGPARNSFDWLAADGSGNVWAAGGGFTAGFYKLSGSTWTNYNTATYPSIGNDNFFRKIYANDNTVWALSYGGGPTLIEGETIRNYNPSNANLPGIPANPNYCTPFGGGFDNQGRFWLSIYTSNNSTNIYCYTGEGQFIGIPNSSFINSCNLEAMAIDNNNTKWIVTNTPEGVYFFNENGTLNNFSDDIFGFYTTGDFGIQDINDVIVDKNGEVWIATNNGVFIISNPLAAIQNPNNKPAPVKLGIIEGNLRVPFTQNCRVIKNDILNEKWIGTEGNGVFHLSSDGSTLIEQFNTSNSPILDNKINSIVVNPETGIAYFGTLKGLSSVTTNAIEPVAEFDEITCSPNPFILPAGVDMKIDGLIENSRLKIINLTGQVIAEFDSPGGRIATWQNSRNLNLPSGVYIVVAFNRNGSKVGKGKFAVIKK